MNKYEKLKNSIREFAVNYQLESARRNTSYNEIVIVTNKLEKVARKYGLLKEFKENGVL